MTFPRLAIEGAAQEIALPVPVAEEAAQEMVFPWPFFQEGSVASPSP